MNCLFTYIEILTSCIPLLSPCSLSISEAQEHSLLYFGCWYICFTFCLEAFTGRMCIRAVYKVSHWHIMYCKTSWSVRGSAVCQNVFSCQLPARILLLKLFEYSWIRLGCMAALFLQRDSPLSRDYLHDLCITPVLYYSVSHDRSHYITAVSRWWSVCQLLVLPFRNNPKLRNTRKTFSCRSAPTLFHATFIFPLSLQGTVWIRIFTVINWPYIDWDAYQCLQ